jgi:hypothetical protein
VRPPATGDTCQDVRLGLFGLIWVAAFRRKCSDGFKVMPKKTKTGSPIYTLYFFILSLSWLGLARPGLASEPANSRRRLTRRIHNLSPKF